MKSASLKPGQTKTRINLGINNVRRRFVHGPRIGVKAWIKKVVLRTADAINAIWKFDLDHKSRKEISVKEDARIRIQYWNLVKELEKSEDEKLPNNKQVKSFVETMIKKKYMTEKLDFRECEALESFKQTARVVAIVGDSLWHWDNQIGEYGDIRILANYLYRHVWIPAFRLRIPVDMLAVMFDLYYENLPDKVVVI